MQIKSYNFLLSVNINKDSAKFLKKITAAANDCIPRKTFKSGNKRSYWWNAALKAYRDGKQDAFHTFQTFPTAEKRIAYRKANAKFKREAKLAKRDSFHKFTSTIAPNTPIKSVFSTVNKLYNKFSPSHIKFIEVDDIIKQATNLKWRTFLIQNGRKLLTIATSLLCSFPVNIILILKRDTL